MTQRLLSGTRSDQGDDADNAMVSITGIDTMLSASNNGKHQQALLRR